MPSFQYLAKHEMKKWQRYGRKTRNCKEAHEQAYLAFSTALKKAIAMLEQWEQENLELRGHIRVLTRRLEQAGGYIDIETTPSQWDRKSHLKPVDQ